MSERFGELIARKAAATTVLNRHAADSSGRDDAAIGSSRRGRR